MDVLSFAQITYILMPAINDVGFGAINVFVIRIRIISFVLFMLFTLSSTVDGRTIYPEPSYLQPIIGTNAYVLSGTIASEVVTICGDDADMTIKYWQPSKAQVSVIDEKLNLKLDNVDNQTGIYNVFKLYFAIEDSKNRKFVYAFVFPASKDKGITVDFQDSSLVCPRLLSIAEFSLEKLELRMLKPDASDTYNGWLHRHYN